MAKIIFLKFRSLITNKIFRLIYLFWFFPYLRVISHLLFHYYFLIISKIWDWTFNIISSIQVVLNSYKFKIYSKKFFCAYWQQRIKYMRISSFMMDTMPAQFIYLGNNISFTENDVNEHIRKAYWVVNDYIEIWSLWWNNGGILQSCSQISTGCLSWTLMKCLEEK